MAGGTTVARGAAHDPRFPLTKFRPTTLPSTLVTRPVLHDRLVAGGGQRLTVVVGSAGAGKSVLLSSWAAARPSGLTSWLSCDEADANPVRFWTGFIEAPRAVMPEFGTDAAELLAMDGVMSADITASIANDAGRLPTGTAIVVDDLHYVAPATFKDLTGLVERWPAGTAQLVLSARSDPLVRLQRLRMAGELCELRDRDLFFSLTESRDLLSQFGVQVSAADLARLHERSEGWAAALQMVALSLRSGQDPERAVRALEINSHAVAEYFIAEVLDQQPAEVAQFMLDTSILDELTVDSCAAVTGRPDAGALLHNIDAASLFVVPLDDERASFRYHHLVQQVLRAELRARDRSREQELQFRAGEWFQAAGGIRQAARHYLSARQADRALALLQDRLVRGFQHTPTLPLPLDLSMIDPSLLADAPDWVVALALDLLLSGDVGHADECLDLLERAKPSIPPESRLAARIAAARSVRHMLVGQAGEAVHEVLAARSIMERAQLSDEWIAAAPMILTRAYLWLEDFAAVHEEASVAFAAPELTDAVKSVMIRGAQALAWFEAGQLAQAANAATAAGHQAGRLGFSQHFFAVDYLRALAGLALERRDLDTAERLTEQALSISERGRPAFEFLALLDRAQIWAASGQVLDALGTIEAARRVLDGTESVLLTRADELEALLQLSLGDLVPAALANRLPAARRDLLLARIALATGDHQAAGQRLQSPSLTELTPRLTLVRQLLLAATAIGRGDPRAANLLSDALQTARHGGFCHTIVTAAPQLTGYLIEHAQVGPDPFMEQVISAAVQVRAIQPNGSQSSRKIIEPLTEAEMRILKLLPTSSYLDIAATLFISRNTVKAHLRSIYRKLGVTSRPEAVERAVDLGLL